MGNFLFSRKKKSTREQLEDIQNELSKIELYKLNAFVSQKNYVALLYITSLIIYIGGLLYTYFSYNLEKKIFLVGALLFIIVVSFLVYLIREAIYWYFRWINENNNLKMATLIKEKKSILSKVQETETFNEAKQILERFDPAALRNLNAFDSSGFSGSIAPQRISAPTPIPKRSYVPPANTTFSTPKRHQQSLMSSSPPAISQSFVGPQMTTPPLSRTVKPILPQNRSVVEKLIDYAFNDGPSNRYALICHHCNSHNGMALPSEFEYQAYFCAYCGKFNPARKQRPQAPKTDSVDPLSIEWKTSTKIQEVSADTKADLSTDEPRVEEPIEDGSTLTEQNRTSIDQSCVSDNVEKVNDERKYDDELKFADEDDDGDGNSGGINTTNDNHITSDTKNNDDDDDDDDDTK